MANLIDYSPYTFDDTAIMSGKVAMSNALMCDSLNPDELSVDVISHDTGNRRLLTVDEEWYTTNNGLGYVVATTDIRQFTYGSPILYYYNDVLVGKYYVRSVDRLSVDHFRISAISAVGLMSEMQHMGGLYTGQTAKSVIEDIMGDIPVYLESDFTKDKIYGWLPVASRRDNLQQVLFAIGASVTKWQPTGDVSIKYLKNYATYTLNSQNIYIGSSYNYKAPATEVVVSEHAFYQSGYDLTVSLFDNTDGSGAVEDLLVTFDNPCYNLSTTGTLTISSSGVNYAVISGTGILSGKEYTHVEKIFSVPTQATGESRVVTVKNATLVTLANSINVAARVVDYETMAEEVNFGYSVSGTPTLVRPTTSVTFTDPYGDTITGFISSTDLTMSGKLKADCTVVKNYKPDHFGNNYRYSKVFSSNTTWTPPAGTTNIRVVIGQGGQAGQNGYNGQNAFYDGKTTVFGGDGGGAGQGGSCGKVYVVDLENPTALTISIGAAGTPSNGAGALGGTGGHSTVTMGGTTYSSNSGTIPEAGYLNIFTGVLYSTDGKSGLNGGSGGSINLDYDDTWSASDTTPAQNIILGASRFDGGSKGADFQNEFWDVYGVGGMGGGAAYGNDGSNGTAATFTSWDTYSAGNGGNGANAIASTTTPQFGCGGVGGHGGGGGGACGWIKEWDGSNYTRTLGTYGTGGSFSKGTNGGKGYVIVFY